MSLWSACSPSTKMILEISAKCCLQKKERKKERKKENKQREREREC